MLLKRLCSSWDMNRGKLGKGLALAVLALCCVGIAAAQSTTNGAIGGGIRDPQGLGVARAVVKVHNIGTGQDTSVTADDQGEFRAASLAPGMYSLAVEQSGFAKIVLENVQVEVGRVTEVEIKLKLSGASETVNVNAEAPLVNTSQADFATSVDEKSISELPINGRRWSTFALLTPGVVPDGSFGLLSFRGISGLLNNNTVDGGDNNQAFFSEEKGRTRISYSIGQASIKEFQVNTSNFSAEYGRAAGGVVNAVTKSGTNEIHGEGFYFIRDNALGATNPFTIIPPQNVPIKPDDRRHQFGGVIGGPLIKDKVFLLLSYDGQRRNFPGVAVLSSPNSLILAPADTATLTGRGVSQTQINNGIALLTSLTGTVPRTGNQDVFFPKLDWHINQSNTFSGSYNKLIWRSPAGIQTQAANNLGKASFGNDYVHGDSAIAHLYSNIGSNITNEVRFQYSRDNEFETTQAPAPGEPTTGPGGSVPDVFVNNVIEFGKPTFLNRKALPDERRFQWADTASLSKGRHLFRFGMDINRVHDISDNLRFEGGSFSYNNLVDFLTDFSVQNGCRVTRGGVPNTPAPCFNQYQQAFGPTRFEFNTYDYGFFLQDDWRIKPHFTINLGVRYEYEQLPSPQIPNPAFPNTASFPSDKNNVGPRFGFAWDLTGDGKTALRGGYGIYYGRIINSTIINAIENTAMPGAQFQFNIFTPDTGFSGPIYPATLASPAGTAAKPSIQFFDRGFQNPLIQEAEVSLERQVGWNTAISVSYLLSRGQELPAFLDTNLNRPTSTITYTVVNGGPFSGQTVTLPFFTGARPNPGFFSITDIASVIRSNYNALVAQVNRRFNRGLLFTANYTYSHAIDNGQTSTTFTSNETALDPFNLQLDKGNAAFNFPHRFVASAVWAPELSRDSNLVLRRFVNGFSISPIITISSGYAFVESVSGSPRAGGVAPQPTSSGIIGSGAAFSLNRFPLAPRNSDHMPNIVNIDLRLSRQFAFTERYRVEVLAEAFNLLNHQEVNGVNQTAYSISGTAFNPVTNNFTANLKFNPFNNFAIPNSAGSSIYRERQIQFGLKFLF
jgi:outer membrane receptor protein involved in Fe transport